MPPPIAWAWNCARSSTSAWRGKARPSTSSSAPAGFDGTLTLVVVVGMMSLGVDWRLALWVLLPFPFMALAFWWVARHVHEASRLSLDRFGTLNDQVQETLSGVRTLRALGLQARSAASAFTWAS